VSSLIRPISPFLTTNILLILGVDKGSALSLLCGHLKIPIERSVAFGDGENDKEFLAIAGMGCAMKNGRPAAIAAADIVTEVSRDII
jgi:hydroxymethylpyrimidine pyrophosphatase-like HAD family hydrolase